MHMYLEVFEMQHVNVCILTKKIFLFLVSFFRYEAIEKHLNHGAWKIEVDMNAGNEKIRSYFVSSLSAFWPALQVLAGDVKKAQASHGAFYSIWKKYSSMPEIFDMSKQKLIQFGKDWTAEEGK